METIIVLISTDYHNARKVCELISNQIFNSYTKLRETINKELELNENDDNQPQFFGLSEFMDECNDEYISIEGNFISYVNINKTAN